MQTARCYHVAISLIPGYTFRRLETRKVRLESSRLDKRAQSRTEQTVRRAAGTKISTPRRMVQPLLAQSMPLPHSEDAQTLEEDAMMCRRQRECVVVKLRTMVEEVHHSA